MKPANWVIELCAIGAHNYAAIIACILISTALAPSLATARERRSGGDESPATLEQHGDFVTVATWYGPGYEGRRMRWTRSLRQRSGDSKVENPALVRLPLCQ